MHWITTTLCKVCIHSWHALVVLDFFIVLMFIQWDRLRKKTPLVFHWLWSQNARNGIIEVHILIFFAIYFLFTLDVIKSDPIQKSVSPTVNSIFPLPLLYVSLNFSGDNLLRIAIWLFLISRKWWDNNVPGEITNVEIFYVASLTLWPELVV